MSSLSTLPKTSFAMVQTGVRQLEGRDIPMPQIADESAILQVEACGICGMDGTGERRVEEEGSGSVGGL